VSVVVQLFIMKGGALEGTEMVSGDRFVIGRDPSSAVVLDDPTVAPRAVGVFVHDGRLAVQDLGAVGGVKVNGEVIAAPRYVNPREDVMVGVYTLKLKLMGRPGETVPPVVASSPPALASPSPPAVAPAPQAKVVPPVVVIATPMGGAKLERLPPTMLLDDGVHQQLVTDEERTIPGPPSVPTDDEQTLVSMSASTQQSLRFVPSFEDDDEHGDDDDEHEPDWSLVERVVRNPQTDASKHPIVEVVHSCGERVVDHRVLRVGQTFALGDIWTDEVRQERGLTHPVPLVRLKADGTAELLGSAGVEGRVTRKGIAAELQPSAPTPLVDGEVASLRVGQERLFVRFASVPELLWTPDQVAEARAERRLISVSAVVAVAFFGFFAAFSWLYGYRSKDEDIIELGDDGFAEIVVKDLQFEEPKEPEKKPEPPPVKSAEPAPQKPSETPPPTKAAPAPEPAPAAETPKPGLAAALQNIPKVADSASSQNLTAALSNIKGVRVPGAAAGFKSSALVGKGPSSGVQIGGAAGGAQTSGLNSLIRKDGAAGSMGEKGERAVAGKVVGQPRLSTVKGTAQLSKDEIFRVITAHLGELQYCYEKQLRTTAGLAGRVVLEWAVTGTGSVGVVKVATSSLPSPEAVNCMTDKVKKWKFPKPQGSGNVEVVYPFVFNTI
jgi:outer membrane biosynthesis protein TonB